MQTDNVIYLRFPAAPVANPDHPGDLPENTDEPVSPASREAFDQRDEFSPEELEELSGMLIW